MFWTLAWIAETSTGILVAAIIYIAIAVSRLGERVARLEGRLRERVDNRGNRR
jgi:hypothetical protein